MQLSVERSIVSFVNIDVPLDVFLIVFQYLESEDLKSVRQACKEFSIMSARSLFRRISISISPQDQQALVDISRHKFGKYVRTLTFDSRTFEERLANNATDYWNEWNNVISPTPMDTIAPSLRTSFMCSFRDYRYLYSEQLEAQRGRTLKACLAMALPSMPRLNRVCISRSVALSKAPVNRMLHHPDPRTRRTMALPPASEPLHLDDPQRYRRIKASNQHAIVEFLQALQECRNHGLESLSIDCELTQDLMQGVIVDEIPMKGLAEKLVHLSLIINLRTAGQTFTADDQLIQLNKMLKPAQTLQSLNLYFTAGLRSISVADLFRKSK
ncbi:hypothetical protein MMC09_002156 [Bachmanniomyces sp. S44760]|nr:hypothetical protein [Bachmanniomyces sp. S44760]